MPEQPHVVVTGSGTAAGTPDRCTLHAELHVMADTAAEAVTQCAQVVRRALDAFQEEGVEPPDVRTTNLSVKDFFDQHQQRVTARVASYQLEATIHRLDDMGKILATLTAAVGDSFQVRALQLTVGDPEPIRREARQLAVHDAQRKAAELAEAAGIRLGALLSLQDQETPRRGPAMRAMMTGRPGAAAALPSVPVEPGTVSVTSSVVLTYAIAG